MYDDVKTAALYVRYSSANQTEQSIEGQTRVCEEFCKKNDIRIVSVYADRATSASKDIEKRVNFLQMIKDSEKHPWDAVIVYKLDRFSRSRYDMATYKYKLKKNGVQLISATEQISQDPEGIILESVLEGMAEFYSAELSQKINRGFYESSRKHQTVGGTLPLGLKIVNKKYEIDEETAPIIREAFQLFTSGTGVAEICRIFNAKGYRTSKGCRFGRSSFAKIFRNEKYIGTYQFRDYKAENAIPALIDRETWDKAQMRLDELRLKAPGSYKAKNVYLLSGKIICGHCGYRMQAGTNKSKNGTDLAYYVCRGKKEARTECAMRNVRKDFIEPLVLQDAYSLLTDENIEEIAKAAVQEHQTELVIHTNIPGLKARLSKIRESLDNLTKAIESGLAPDTLVKRMMTLESEKRTLEAELKEEEKYIPKNIDEAHIIYWLESLKEGDIQDENFQKQLIDLFVNSVTITSTDTPGFFNIQIAYNLTNQKTKTYKNIGFESHTSKLEVKSDFILVHTIKGSYWSQHVERTIPSMPADCNAASCF